MSDQQVIAEPLEWAGLPPEIAATSWPIAEAGMYDDAILAAFRLVEGRLQNRLGTASIGQPLLAEAFDSSPPRVDIGRPIDRSAIRDLFSGALGHIRNDRAHKLAPALPCTSLSVCISYLHFAALLLYLLSKDKAIAPQVESVSVRAGSIAGIEIFGVNFNDAIRVLANGEEMAIVQRNSNLLDVRLPSGFMGLVEVYDGNDLIFETPCSARSLDSVPVTFYEILFDELPLYGDAEASQQLSDVVGIQVRAYEGGHVFRVIWPVERGKYRKRQIVSHGPWGQEERYGDTWYRDPASNEVKLAWNSAALWRPDVIGDAAELNLSAVAVLPGAVSIDPGGVRTLTARGILSIGSYTVEQSDLEARWSSSDSRVAHVKEGVLYAKAFGSCSITAEYRGFKATANVNVEQQPPGGVTTFFEGLRRTQKMVFDHVDNLYITNQTNKIWRLNRGGRLDIVAQLARSDDHSFNFDCLARDAAGCLYVTSPQPRMALKLCQSGETFTPVATFGEDDYRVKKDVALTRSGALVIGMMGNQPGEGSILIVDPSGRSWSFEARDSAHSLCVGGDDRIYTLANRYGAIDIYEQDGALIESFEHGLESSIGAMTTEPAGSILLGGFHTGSVTRYERVGHSWMSTTVATGLGVIGGLAIDSRGHIYVSDFQSGRINIIH